MYLSHPICATSHTNPSRSLVVLVTFTLSIVAIVYLADQRINRRWGTSANIILGNRSGNTSLMALAANLPQIILSICYFAVNSECTSMAGAYEWNKFGSVRKASVKPHVSTKLPCPLTKLGLESNAAPGRTAQHVLPATPVPLLSTARRYQRRSSLVRYTPQYIPLKHPCLTPSL
jgi:hypothetical protein